MTTKTGATSMAVAPDGPPLVAALGGAVLQLGTLGYTWYTHTSAGECMRSPLNCLMNGTSSDAWGLTVVIAGLIVLLAWLGSLRTLPSRGTTDPSIVDRLWSILPWLYNWFWYVASGFKPRLAIMACLSTLWGARLTYNFWIKGGYGGGEDYRWAVVRTWYKGWQWEVFNLVFVCSFQLVCILAFAVPGAAALHSDSPLNFLDAVAAALYLLLVCGETVADRQMYEFQTEKYRRIAAGEAPGPYARGFVESGLWALSRHPNYFCEVTMWWAFYLFSVAATGRWLNWTIWGAVFLTGLFVPPGASLDVTESLSLSKYPVYREYQQRVSRFIPWFPKRASAAEQASKQE